MRRLKLGDSELEVLRYVARHPLGTVREACEYFAEARGWARTTVLKTLDRLREKDLVKREDVDGVFRYSSTLTDAEIEENLVHQFVSQSMEGSVKSVVAYLHTYPELSADDVSELRKLVEDLEKKQK